MAPSRPRYLVIGLDGGTFDLLDPLMAAGDLPFLSDLAARGLRSPLRSVFPPKTIPAWYSFVTGLDPGSLGIFGFTEPDGARAAAAWSRRTGPPKGSGTSSPGPGSDGPAEAIELVRALSAAERG